MSASKAMSAEEFDRIFDAGQEDVLAYADLSTARRVRDEAEGVRKVNCTLPGWVVEEAELEARHLAVSRSAVLNMWPADKAEQSRARRAAS